MLLHHGNRSRSLELDESKPCVPVGLAVSVMDMSKWTRNHLLRIASRCERVNRWTDERRDQTSVIALSTGSDVVFFSQQ